jgi:hypothetical protein
LPGVTVFGLAVVASDHTYVVAPDAVNVALNPWQIAGELTVTFKVPLTFIVPTAEEEHPADVPVTV